MVSERKYTRREVLKQGVRVSAGAGAYGAIGGFLGKMYESLGNMYGRGIKEAGERLGNLDNEIEEAEPTEPAYVAKPVKRIEDARIGFFKKIFGRTEEDVEKFQKKHEYGPAKKPATTKQKSEKEETAEEETSRRGFINYILGYMADNPVVSGIGIGAGYGTVKTLPDVPGAFATAGLRDDVAHLKKYSGRLEEEVRQLKGAIGGLEKKTEEDKSKNMLIFLGIAGLVLTILFSSINLTGNVIAEKGADFSIISLITFFFSIFLIASGSSAKHLNR